MNLQSDRRSDFFPYNRLANMTSYYMENSLDGKTITEFVYYVTIATVFIHVPCLY